MSNTNGAIVAYETDHGKVELTPEIVRRQLVNGNGAVTDQEVGMFLQLCKYQKLNPFLKEAYLIKYGNQDASIITGKDVFIKRAAKHDQFDGMESGLYLQPKNGGEVTRRTGAMWLPGEKIAGAWAIVHRKDWKHPVESSVSLAEYIGKKRDGTVNSQWSRMPGTMIIKVAEGHALRKAFPADFQGLYDAAEMSHIELPDEERNVTPDPVALRRTEYVEAIRKMQNDYALKEEGVNAAIEYLNVQKSIETLDRAFGLLKDKIDEDLRKRDDAIESQPSPEEPVDTVDSEDAHLDDYGIPEDIF